MDALERRALERIPLYSMVRSLGRRLVGQEEGTRFSAALAVIEDALVPAFIVEEHEDGRYTVFVPAVPTFGVGGRLCHARGAGAGELLRAIRRP
jgi:hypothetical protein